MKQYPKSVHIYFDKQGHPYNPFLITPENLPPQVYRCFQYTTEMFQKMSQTIKISKKGLESLAPCIKVLTKAERLPWHYESVRATLEDQKKRIKHDEK